MKDKEEIFWEALKQLPEHKREFDEDVFQTILQAMETYKTQGSKETRLIPLWQLKEIENTLRMVSNTLKSPKRTTCLDRCVMEAWNFAFDSYYLQAPTDRERRNYYLQTGQVPCIKKG